MISVALNLKKDLSPHDLIEFFVNMLILYHFIKDCS